MFEVNVVEHPAAEAAAGYGAYRAAVAQLIERFGGRYLVRAGHGRALEGRQTHGRWHLIEFPDAESAQRFWDCPEYAALKPLRSGAADVRAVLVEPPT
ncbi:MAG: DUF1330 domain-containing protein [Actinomycetota bacterium]|nr:DUF1330 domain-containing protein [Actinomycetota bacterium]